MGTLLFNWCGYQLLYRYLQLHEDHQLETRYDNNNYNPNDLVEIKIPLHLPYLTNWSDFRRCDGEIDLNGIHYKFVKRRVYNDSLVLLCLVNQSKQQLKYAGTNYFKQANGLQSSGHAPKETNPFFKTLLSEYKPEHTDWQMTVFLSKKSFFSVKEPAYTCSCSAAGPDQPPDQYTGLQRLS